MIEKEDLSRLKKQLEKTKKDLEAELKSLAGVPEMGSDVDAFDTETDEAEEFSNKIGVEQTVKERLEDVRVALEKIEKEDYGKCGKCGMEISLEVLNLVPESRYCKQCK